MKTDLYFLEIELVNGSYEGLFHQPNSNEPYRLLNLGLDYESQVVVKGQQYTLGHLIALLIDYEIEGSTSIFDEKAQLDIGEYLYAQTFGKMSRSEQEHLRKQEKIDLHIVTRDENITRLPWVLIADGGVFLCANPNGWSISLSTHKKYTDCVLPPSPKILLVMPQPKGEDPTGASVHYQKLKKILDGHNLVLAETWEEFKEQLASLAPEVIYFYGHGIGDWNRARLLFASGDDHTSVEKPIIDVANCLRHIPQSPPRLVYLNCCYGDAGGALGAGRQLGDFIPAVITNSTAVRIPTAQKQGLVFLRRVLQEGHSPHEAIHKLRSDLSVLDLTYQDIRWITPVLYRCYHEWTTLLSPGRNRLKRDPYWHLKVNRLTQFAVIHYNTGQMLRYQSPRAFAYMWYGEEDQGVNAFGERVEVELKDFAADGHFRKLTIDWKYIIHDPHSVFEDMFTSALPDRKINSVDEIPSCIASEMQGNSEQPTLIYITHAPLSLSVMQPRNLKRFLKWWAYTFVEALSKKNMFAVLGLSFIVEDSEQFIPFVQHGINDWRFEKIGFKPLDELNNLELKDLIECLERHRINFPPKRRNKYLRDVLGKTMGHYDQTVSAMDDIELRVWALDFDEDDEDDD